MPGQTDVRTQLTREIKLSVPLVSSAMDTVTEARMAVALAQQCGLGIVHKNMSAQRQAREVLAVKKYESGVITEPVTVPPDMTIRDVIALREKYKISGVPVVQGDELVGSGVIHR